MDAIDKKYFEKRERLLNAIRYQPVDRLPYSGVMNGTVDSLQKAAGGADYYENPKEVYAAAMRHWDADCVLQFVLPDRLDRKVGPNAEVDVHNGIMSVLYRMVGEWIKEHGKFESAEDIRDFCLTVPDVSEAPKYVDVDNVRQRYIELIQWGDFLKPAVWLPTPNMLVDWMWYTSMGYENYLMAHLLYPEELERLFAFMAEEKHLSNTVVARTIMENDMVPLVYGGSDICGNDGPLVSPETLRQLYFPHLKRAISPIVESGIHWLWHSDGDIMPIVPDLMDCGIDGFQGFEEDKGMDMYALSETSCKNGKLPFLHGSINVTTTMYQGVGDVRKDVKRMVDLSDGRGGGIILGTSSSIMDNVSTENIFAMYDAFANQDNL
ncbi:MAG: uroporphyrinogen decarboxylase family protein [Verrucomicrobiota bacterium]